MYYYCCFLGFQQPEVAQVPRNIFHFLPRLLGEVSAVMMAAQAASPLRTQVAT